MILRRSIRHKNAELFPIDLEIERTCRKNRVRRRLEMAENNRVEQQDERIPPIVPPPQNQAVQPRLRDIQRPVIAVNPCCIQLYDAARNYELKSFHMNLLPTFNGLGSEDALGFMRELYSTVQTLPLNNLSEEELRMKCFPYCMRGDARQWLLNLPEGSLRTWDDVYNVFMFKYYSSQKTMDYRSRICTFTQREGELFHEVWDRFNLLLTQCPHHQFPLLLLTQFFYDGLTPNCQSLVDTAAGGYTGDKNSDELQAIFESLASNSRQKAVRGRRAAVHEISTQSELTTQVAELTKQINLLMTRDNSNREFCAYCNTYGHNSSVCMNAESSQPSYEEANYMGSNTGRQPPRNDPYSHTYNPGWRNHPNFSWRDQGNARPMGPPGFQQQGPSGFQHQQYRPFQQPPAPQQSQLPAQEKKPQLEEMFMQYMSSQDTMMKKLDAKIDKVAQSSQASIHNLEVQVGQLVKLVAEKDRGKFPSATEINPREGAMAVTLRSGKMLNEVSKEKEPLAVEKESDKEGEQLPKESSRKLIFRVGKEKEEFSISKAIKLPTFDESCLFVDVIEKPSKEVFCKHSPSDPLETCPIEKKEPEFVESMMRLEGQDGWMWMFFAPFVSIILNPCVLEVDEDFDGMMTKLRVIATCWCIWREHNEIVWNHKNRQCLKVKLDVLRLVQDWQQSANDIPSNVNALAPSTSVSNIPNDMVVVHVDVFQPMDCIPQFLNQRSLSNCSLIFRHQIELQRTCKELEPESKLFNVAKFGLPSPPTLGSSPLSMEYRLRW
nr:Integrase, catalytic core [Ipomoea batatas]